MRTLSCLSLLLAVAAPAAAQQVTLFGKVVARGTGFALECTAIALRSTRLSLTDFEGKIAEVRGTNTGSITAPVIEVSALRRAEHTFAMNGGGRIGGSFDLEARSESARLVVIYVSTGTGFVPLEPFSAFLHGTFLLDPRSFLYLSSGSRQAGYRVEYPIPNVAALVGLEVFTQAAVLVGRELTYINSACRTIRAR